MTAKIDYYLTGGSVVLKSVVARHRLFIGIGICAAITLAQYLWAWQLVSGLCNPTVNVPGGILCQSEVQNNNFIMNLTPGMVSGPTENYVFNVSVHDSYGNSTTKQLSFNVTPYDYQSSGQGN